MQRSKNISLYLRANLFGGTKNVIGIFQIWCKIIITFEIYFRVGINSLHSRQKVQQVVLLCFALVYL